MALSLPVSPVFDLRWCEAAAGAVVGEMVVVGALLVLAVVVTVRVGLKIAARSRPLASESASKGRVN